MLYEDYEQQIWVELICRTYPTLIISTRLQLLNALSFASL